MQPAPAPRFSRSQPAAPRPPERAQVDPADALRGWGFGDAEVAAFARDGAFAAPRR